MTDNDLKLLATVLREARELAEACGEDGECCDYCDGCPPGQALLEALDQFKFKATFSVPE
jgi:hypothetical protein